MAQVVGVSPETGEAIRSRVRNLEELKVFKFACSTFANFIFWYDHTLNLKREFFSFNVEDHD